MAIFSSLRANPIHATPWGSFKSARELNANLSSCTSLLPQRQTWLFCLKRAVLIPEERAKPVKCMQSLLLILSVFLPFLETSICFSVMSVKSPFFSFTLFVFVFIPRSEVSPNQKHSLPFGSRLGGSRGFCSLCSLPSLPIWYQQACAKGEEAIADKSHDEASWPPCLVIIPQPSCKWHRDHKHTSRVRKTEAWILVSLFSKEGDRGKLSSFPGS